MYKNLQSNIKFFFELRPMHTYIKERKQNFIKKETKTKIHSKIEGNKRIKYKMIYHYK